MRIGIVTETYPPEINGVALTVRNLTAGLAARGHRIELILPRRKDERGNEAGVETVHVHGGGLPGYPGLRFGLPAGNTLRKRWSRQRPDAIYVATEGPLGWSAMRTAAALGIPASTGFHTRFDHYAGHYGYGWLAPLVRGYLTRFHQRGAATLVPTDALAQELRSMGVGNARLLRRGVDTSLFHPRYRDSHLRQTWGVRGTAPVVLYVGRIAAEKNLNLAVRTFQAIKRAVPDARYVWVGDGPARAALERAHPEFIFVGMQHGEALARHVASADLFTFPSLSETFGNVILEALAAGLPVVAYAEGASREHLCDGINGFCIVSGDERDFIAKAVQLAGDSELIGRMGQAARIGTADLSPSRVIDDFEHVLRDIAEESSHAQRALASA